MTTNRRKQLLIPRDHTGDIYENITHNKNESENEIKQNLDIVPTTNYKLEATVKVENWTESHVENLVKCEIFEFDNTDAGRADNDSDSTAEKIPKTQTEIVADRGDYFCTSSDSDNDPNSDHGPEERDPFEDVDLDPSFSKPPPNHNNSNDSSPASQVQLINPASVNDSLNPSFSPEKSVFATTSTTAKANPSQYDHMGQTLDTRFRCQLCLELRYSETWLETHLETCAASHKDGHRFCVQCNTLFVNAKGLRGHSIRMHGAKVAEVNKFPFKCQFCSCAFALRESLVPHLAAHPMFNTTEDVEDLKRRPYRCQECPLTFRHYSVFALHMRTHTNGREFKCPHCESAFNSQGCLKGHLRNLHFDARPFKCPEPNCGKTFRLKQHLRTHMHRVHP